MKKVGAMIKDLYEVVGTDKLEPLEERFIVKAYNRTSNGDVEGTLSDPDQMAVRRLHSKYCTK